MVSNKIKLIHENGFKGGKNIQNIQQINNNKISEHFFYTFKSQIPV